MIQSADHVSDRGKQNANDPRLAIRRLNLLGFAALVLLVAGLGGWAATAELAGAVIAPGALVVESNVKKVQHSTGGIVGQIFVREGSIVEQDQLLIRLDETLTRATLGIVRSQVDELTARESRLLAEREGATQMTFPEALLLRRSDAAVGAAIAGEEKLFESRRNSRTGQSSQLRERVAQVSEEIRGLSAQLAAKESEIKFIAEELAGVADLYKRNLVTIVRYNQLQRDDARLQGERGQLIADRARARGRIGEIELQVLQLEKDFQTEVLKDLRETQGKLAELRERMVAAEDQLRRVEIRAPQAGVVYQLSVHTVGGVIQAGETIMQIVPGGDELVVEAKVAPQDVDQVAVGAKVGVRIMAGNQRMTPTVEGMLTRVSADLTREQQTNQAYYLVRASLNPGEVRRLGELKLVPGMLAEAHIQTYARTPLEYLLKPLQDQIARTFRER
jgi:HlyD family secretion protein